MKGKWTMRKKYMVLLVLITCLPCSAWALELPLVNGDFELLLYILGGLATVS